MELYICDECGFITDDSCAHGDDGITICTECKSWESIDSIELCSHCSAKCVDTYNDLCAFCKGVANGNPQ